MLWRYLALLSLLDDLLPLVVSFLLQLLQAAEVVIFYVLLFVFSKYHICQVRSVNIDRFVALRSRLKPRVVQGLLGGEPLPIIYLNQAANQVFCLVGNFFALEIEAAFQDQLVQLLHGVASERHCAEEHYIQADASTPHVGLEASIALLSDDFRCDVCRRATLLVHFLLLGLELP